MAFFKSRSAGESHSPSSHSADSVEALRRRARHRLIGAAVLVLIGVIGLPLVLDKQPRPIAVDIPIEIPDKAKVKPLVASLPSPPAATEVETVLTPARPVAAVSAPTPSPAPVAAASASPVPAPTPVATRTEAKPNAAREVTGVVTAQATPTSKPAAAKPESKPEHTAKPEAKPEVKPVAKPPEKVTETVIASTPPKKDDGAKARALLEGKDPAAAPDAPTAASGPRFVVQIGAYADAAKAREARLKVEHAGMKTYTQVAQLADGKRIRVRVGPFADRAQAQQAAEKIKKLDLGAAILEL